MNVSKLMSNPIARVVLTLLATLRMTRFITSDFLGEWTIVGPAKKWAWRNEARVNCDHDGWYEEQDEMRAAVSTADPVPTPDASWGWRSKLVKGLDCPYCVGFWIGAAVLLVSVLPLPKPLSALRSYVLGAFALNYVVGQVSSRVDG